MTIELLATDTDNLIQLITAIGNLSVILVLFIIGASVLHWVFTYERRHRESMNRYQEWYDEVVSDPNPDRTSLIKIVKLHGRKSPIFYQAVQEKLESYEHTANTIEATMSPVQLYEVGNPLWTKGLSINAIRGFLLLHQIAEKENINSHDYLEAYVADVRSGTSVSEAYDKQEVKLKTN